MSTQQPDLIWASVLVAIAATVAVAEHRGLKTPEPGHTATATWKRWLGINPRRRRFVPCSVAFILTATWFVLHIILDGEWVPRWISLKARSS